MARRQRGRSVVRVVLALVGASVLAVAVVRRQRLSAATRDFHERHGPLEVAGTTG